MMRKKIYNKPNINLMAINIEQFIAASPNSTPNQITGNGGGVNTGGYSQEGGSEDNGNGSVGDMAKKYHFDAWSTWD